MSERLQPARRKKGANGDDAEPCGHGSYEVLVNGGGEPRRLVCADCGEEWEVNAT